MKKLEFIVRPSKFEAVKEALSNYGIKGLTVTNVTGCGLQGGRTEYYRGSEYVVNLLPKVKVETVVSDDKVEDVAKIVQETAATGQIGDGKIFICPVDDAIRIRTGERGEEAL